jgi:hypothetical protein
MKKLFYATLKKIGPNEVKCVRKIRLNDHTLTTLRHIANHVLLVSSPTIRLFLEHNCMELTPANYKAVLFKFGSTDNPIIVTEGQDYKTNKDKTFRAWKARLMLLIDEIVGDFPQTVLSNVITDYATNNVVFETNPKDPHLEIEDNRITGVLYSQPWIHRRTMFPVCSSVQSWKVRVTAGSSSIHIGFSAGVRLDASFQHWSFRPPFGDTCSVVFLVRIDAQQNCFIQVESKFPENSMVICTGDLISNLNWLCSDLELVYFIVGVGYLPQSVELLPA